MKRRDFLFLGSAMLVAARPASADPIVDSLIQELREEGYRNFEISSTFLGRTRIEASSATRRREIVLNPRTGEILRDYWVKLDNAVTGSGGTEADDEPEADSEDEPDDDADDDDASDDASDDPADDGP